MKLEMKDFQKLKMFWEAKLKRCFSICGLMEKKKNKGVQLQKEQIIYFTFDAYGTEQKPKPPAKYFLELLILDILQHSHPHRACLTMGEIRWIM